MASEFNHVLLDFIHFCVLLCTCVLGISRQKMLSMTAIGRLAQLDRASASGAEGRAFESRIAHCGFYAVRGAVY